MDIDLSPAALFGNLLFGAIGFACWQYGRRRQSARQMGLGAALMIYPWFFDGGVMLWVVGAVLTALVFWP